MNNINTFFFKIIIIIISLFKVVVIFYCCFRVYVFFFNLIYLKIQICDHYVKNLNICKVKK